MLYKKSNTFLLKILLQFLPNFLYRTYTSLKKKLWCKETYFTINKYLGNNFRTMKKFYFLQQGFNGGSITFLSFLFFVLYRQLTPIFSKFMFFLQKKILIPIFSSFHFLSKWITSAHVFSPKCLKWKITSTSSEGCLSIRLDRWNSKLWAVIV